MSSNIIMRPVYNRPEMLQLSLEYEIEARKHYLLDSDLTTVFIVEHGSPNKTLELIKEYPFEYECIYRDQKFGLTMNILEGMKAIFPRVDDYIIYIEDDVLIHKTYFEFMAKVMETVPKNSYSILSPFNKGDGHDVNVIQRAHHYAALAPLIDKEFFNHYVLPCATTEYYSNPPMFVKQLANKYKKYWEAKQFKYGGNRISTHWEQAGLINRLVDVAMIEEYKCVICPAVNRQIHIGFYGKNRPGGKIPGKTYVERLDNLREIVLDADKMYALTGSKQYNDYLSFSPLLETWDGTLYLKDGVKH